MMQLFEDFTVLVRVTEELIAAADNVSWYANPDSKVTTIPPSTRRGEYQNVRAKIASARESLDKVRGVTP